MFWISVLVIIAVVFALILVNMRGNLSANQTREAAARALFDAQIAEIERGSVTNQYSDTETSAMRAEAERALNRALRRDEDAVYSKTPRGAVAVVLASTAFIALGGYLFIGLPGFPDMGLAERQDIERPSYARALEVINENNVAQPLAILDAETASLKTQLLAAIENQPDDPRGYQFLARIAYTENDYQAAAAAQQTYIDLIGDDALAADYSLLAETMILATNGYVSPEAEANLRATLERDPRDPVGLFYTGVTMRQSGDDLDAQRIFAAMRDAQIGGVQMQAEIERQLAELAPSVGPTSEDIANAANLSDAERNEMIGGMVAQLEGRLARDGGQPSDWARLINAHFVLGNTDKAQAILAEAREKFPDATEFEQFE